MRIIAGTRARMTLLAPKDMTTRPIPDMVKEALFSILRNDIKEKVVADLFSGTGSMGLEAISRGATHALFVDMDRDALKRLNSNIEKLKFEDQCTVLRADIFKYGVPRSGKLRQWQTETSLSGVDIVFCDPPFPLAREIDEKSKLGLMMTKISKQIDIGSIVVLRNEKKFPTLDDYGQLKLTDRRNYGIMTLNIYRKMDLEISPEVVEQEADDTRE